MSRGETMKDSPFQPIEPGRVVAESELAVAFYDRFPVSPGHTLVVPKRVVACLFELAPEERAAVWELVAVVRERLAREYRPDGFNVGLNDGPVAGQTVMHAHVHVIPRYRGDQAEPEGGVRGVIPEKRRYR